MSQLTIILAAFLCVRVADAAEPGRYFKLEVVDEQTGRGVPLVELATVHNIRSYTDSNGIVAFDEPGLMDQKVFFHVRSHGYEFPKDGFGFRGKILDVRAGGSARLAIRRLNLAERLYRITGGGIYRDSLLVGAHVPTRSPLLCGQVLGQDTVMAIPWQGKIAWFWGDTNRPKYPLGQYHTSGATSLLPGRGGLDPSVGVDLDYFVDREGFSRPMCPIPGSEPVWIDGLLTVPDETGQERLVTHYARMKSLGETVEHGLAIFDQQRAVFTKHTQFDLQQPSRCPRGHPLRIKEGGVDYWAFPTPFVTLRVRAELKCVADPACYEAFTCLTQGDRYERATAKVQRDTAGKLVYGWKLGAETLTAAQERELIAAGTIRPAEARYQIRDVQTRKPIQVHTASIQWNDFRRKWIMIAGEAGGSTSYLGEIWFAEADAPTGPWHCARKIVTHDRYSFYNPVHHPFFDQQGGKLIYFEGTYCNTFSGNPEPTPRYEYNQIMYRLDLSDPRLANTP